jgi:hypothetical protein
MTSVLQLATMTSVLQLATTSPVLQLVGSVEVPTLARALTALVGFFVAYQAFRGYRRNDSRPMLFLSVGIAFVTTVSFVVSTLVARPLGASEGLAVLSWTLANVAGLAAIFYAFTGAAGGGGRGRREHGERSPKPEPDGGEQRPDTPGDGSTDGGGR